jgi:hypothetical protein
MKDGRVPHWVLRLGVVAAVVIAIVLAGFRIRAMVLSQPYPPGSDAASYVLAATALREGENPYAEATWATLMPQLPYPVLPYLYPPLLAVLTMPLTGLPAEAATQVFVLVAFISAIVFCILLRRWLGWITALVMVFLFLPTWATIYFGQIGFVIAALSLLALWAIEVDKPITLSVALFLGALLKITPGAGILLLLQRRYWKPLLAGLAVAALVVILTLQFVTIQQWVEGSTIALRVPWRAWWLASWTGMLTFYLTPPYGEALSAILGLTALAYTLLRLRKLPAALALSALLLLPLLFARITWGHHAVTALPVLAVLWKRSPGNRLLAAFAWVLITLLDFRGLAPALSLCWAACVWPEHTGYLDRFHQRLGAFWARLDGTQAVTESPAASSRHG